MEFVASNLRDPVNMHDRHIYNSLYWEKVVPPNLPLQESVRRSLGEILDERWVVDPVDDRSFLVRRTDRPDLVIKVERRRTNMDGDPRNPRSPFRIRSVGPYGCVIEGVLVSMVFPADAKIRRPDLAKFTQVRGPFSNRAFSFDVFRKNESLGLAAHLSGIWDTIGSDYFKRHPERIPQTRSTDPHSLLTLRTAWAAWVLASLAQSHLDEPHG
jgi:hypothetical protein